MLLAGVPLAYIFKQCFFYDSFFYINENVLIPRLESELLIEEALKLLSDNMRLAEVGIGSGALSLSILKATTKKISIVGSDISKEALNVAEINKFRLEPLLGDSKRLGLTIADRLEHITKPIDGVITNPPYIKMESDRDAIHPQVLNFEPEQALFLPDKTYDLWFTDFFKDAYNKVNPGGFFLMEGHERHLKRLEGLLSSCGFENTTIIKDLTGRDRLVKGYRSYG